jgi:hypothetical protein
MTLSLEPRPMPKAMLRRWRPRIERRTAESLWGKRRYVVPRLVPFLWGDGKQWIYLSPTNQRPAYYVVRIDSRVELSNWANDNALIDTCLDSILGEIGDYFGEPYDDEPLARWPELDWTNGGEWGPYTPQRMTSR